MINKTLGKDRLEESKIFFRKGMESSTGQGRGLFAEPHLMEEMERFIKKNKLKNKGCQILNF